MVTKKENHLKHWSQEDLDYLYDNFGVIPLYRMATFLKRTPKAVWIRIHREFKNGISYNTGLLPAPHFAKIAGIGPTAINNWIHKKGLKTVQPLKFNRKDQFSQHYLTEETFWKFVKQNKDWITFSSFDLSYAEEVPDWVHELIKNCTKQKFTFIKMKEALLIEKLYKRHYPYEVISNRTNRSVSSISKYINRRIKEGGLEKRPLVRVFISESEIARYFAYKHMGILEKDIFENKDFIVHTARAFKKRLAQFSQEELNEITKEYAIMF